MEAQHVELLNVAGLGGDVFAGKLPAVGDSRGQTEAGFVDVKHVPVAFIFQFLHLDQEVGFVGVVVRVLRSFQGVAKAPPGPSRILKKRNVQVEKSLTNAKHNVVVTSLSYCRLARTRIPGTRPTPCPGL